MNIVIALKAAEKGLTRLHADRDFDRMAQHSPLEVETWAGRVPER